MCVCAARQIKVRKLPDVIAINNPSKTAAKIIGRQIVLRPRPRAASDGRGAEALREVAPVASAMHAWLAAR